MRRASSVARAVAFTLADTITQKLRELGYEVLQSDGAGPQLSGRGLIVSGVFRSINEGHRRRLAAKDASVTVTAEIDYQTGGARPQRVMAFQLGSRQIPDGNPTQHESGVNAAAIRMGGMIAPWVAEAARRINWADGSD